MENLPKKLFERDIELVNCGLSDIYFFQEDEMDEGQAGFRHDGEGNKIEDWIGDEYVVIGIDSCCGDPIITDITKEELPIYCMFHDDWSTLEQIAYNFEQFLEILHMIDDANIGDEKEKEELKAKIKEIVPEEGYEYWECLLQIGYEFINGID